MKQKKVSLIIIFFLFLMNTFPLPVTATSQEVKIGVLAHRGKEVAKEDYQPLAEYLNKELPQYRFSIVPLDLAEINPATSRKEISLVITNPTSYVEIESQHGATRIATISSSYQGQKINNSGSLIFTRVDRVDINYLEDLKGKVVMAIAREAFSGWQIAWKEFLDQGIDPDKHFKELVFSGFPQDQVVQAVYEGKVDAGIIKTGVLETLVAEGKYNINNFKVLNPLSYPGFGFLVSTPLYPEGVLAKLEHTTEELTKDILVKLLALSPDDPVCVSMGSAGFTIPLSYQPVRNLQIALRLPPFEDYGKVTLWQAIIEYWYLVVLTIFLMLVFVLLLWSLRLNQRALKKLNQTLEDRVAARTKELATQIEERDKMYKSLQESEKRFQHLFDHAPIALYEEDFSQVKEYLEELQSQGVVDIRAYFLKNPEELRRCAEIVKIIRVNNYGKTMHQIEDGSSHPDTLSYIFKEANYPLFLEELLAITERKTLYEKEYSEIGSNNESATILLKWQVLPGFENTYARVLVTEIDLSNLRWLERKLDEKQEEINLMISAGHLGLWNYDLTNNKAYFSSECQKMLGYEKWEIANAIEEWVNLVHPEDKEKMIATLNQEVVLSLNNQKVKISEEVRLKAKDGSYKWILVQGEAAKNLAGQIVFLRGINLDINNLKTTQANLVLAIADLNLTIKIITTCLSIVNLEEMFAVILNDLGEWLDLEGGTVCLLKPDNTLQMVASKGLSPEFISYFSQDVVSGTCRCAEVWDNHKPLILKSKEEISAYATAKSIGDDTWELHMVFPLSYSGVIYGNICLFSRQPRQIDPRKLTILEYLTGQIAMTLERKILSEQIKNYTQNLEVMVREKTAELEERNQALERLNKFFVDRELKMVELKTQIKELEAKLSQKTDES